MKLPYHKFMQNMDPKVSSENPQKFTKAKKKKF